jgi:hypothetical protein
MSAHFSALQQTQPHDGMAAPFSFDSSVNGILRITLFHRSLVRRRPLEAAVRENAEVCLLFAFLSQGRTNRSRALQDDD